MISVAPYTGAWIETFEVLPIANREVPQRIFDQLRDVTKDNGALVALRKVEDMEDA